MIPYSQLRRQPRIDLASSIPLKGPMTVHIETTNVCNFKCVFCPESFPTYKEQAGGYFTMGIEDFRRVCGQVKDFGTVKSLNFHIMGEPLANKRLFECVSLAKQIKAAERLAVTTNGSLLKPAIFQDVIDSGLDYLRVSIYGATERLHKQRSKSSVSIEQIRNQVLGLKEFRDGTGSKTPSIYVKTISQTEQENEDFKTLFSGCADEVCVEPVMNWNDPTEGNLSGLDTETMLAKRGCGRKEVCPFPFYTLAVHADLRVSVCCVDWNKKAVVGDLKSETLQEVWSGKRLREFQQVHIRRKRCELEACKSCTFLHTSPDNLDSIRL